MEKENKELVHRIKGLYSLWGEWTLSFGSMALTVGLSFIIPKIILPLVVLVMAWGLNYCVSVWKQKGQNMCARVTSLTARTLVLSAIIMIAMLLMCRLGLMEKLFDAESLNPDVPYITSLIIFPVGAFYMTIGNLRHENGIACNTCKLSMGSCPITPLVGNLLHKQARLQIQLLMVLCYVLSIVNWAYWALFYINVNINNSDKFFFLIVPVVCYILSLFYIGANYRSIIEGLKILDRMYKPGNLLNRMRFLILRGDEILLTEQQPDPVTGSTLIDTPASAEVDKHDKIDIDKARSLFVEISGTEEFEIKELYSNLSVADTSMEYHYLVNIPEDKPLPESWKLPREGFCTLATLDRILKTRTATPELAAEIYRIYTISMAWKTYDYNGRRLYPIKHYKPTFRLRDIKDWNVDYNDTRWIFIHYQNQDVPFFNLRRLWHKFTRAHSY